MLSDSIKYQGRNFLTTKQLAVLFNVEQKIVSRNFQRNSHRYEEGRHYIVLKGAILKEFKKLTEQKELLKFVSVLYLWTKEGSTLLAKSCTSNQTWEALDSKLEDAFQ
ncbi:hypothetical protein HNO89_001361 [Sporosarcina luteola]|nr:hypothetical protein [Sporosarcina luteola]